MSKFEDIKRKRKARILGSFHVAEWDEKVFVLDVPAKVGIAKISKVDGGEGVTEETVDDVADALSEFLADEHGVKIFDSDEGRELLCSTGFKQLNEIVAETMRIYTGGPEKNDATAVAETKSETPNSPLCSVENLA